MKYFETILDITTGETTIREYTKAEIDAVEKEKAEVAAEQNLKDFEQKTKATAKAALLTRLGITAEEATLLLS